MYAGCGTNGTIVCYRFGEEKGAKEEQKRLDTRDCQYRYPLKSGKLDLRLPGNSHDKCNESILKKFLKRL